MRIAFIGLGVMGAAMAGNLAAAGHAVTGFDADAQAGAGLPRAPGAAEAVRDAEVVLAMLPHGRVVRAVVEEIAGAMPAGCLFVDHSSSEPWLTRESAALLATRGIRMVDAPVSGGGWGARDGELVFMCGGEDADIAEIRPLLDIMGRAAHHVGPLSAGHVMKAINNVITAAAVTATAEAMQMGEAHGLDPAAMVDVLDDCTGQSWWTTNRLRQDVLNGAFADGFKLSLMRKDVDIACELAAEKGLAPEVLRLNRRMWHDAEQALGPDSAVTSMVRHACANSAGKRVT